MASSSSSVEAGQGEAMMALIRELYPICRSITGEGLRETLRVLQQHIPLSLHEVPSGTSVFDWTVPDEWNIRDAYIKNARGERVVDFRKHSLHVVNYSVPVRERMSLAELRPHLHTLSEHPNWIPYRTSYYDRTWGFCLSHNTLLTLGAGDYEVVIDSTLEPGSLDWGELVLPGEREDEVLFSVHCCHPSLANDNLSGVAVATALAQALSKMHRRYTYRFLFLPATIGAITWLSLNETHLPHVKHGLVLAGVGDSGPLHYKRSRQGDAGIDLALDHLFAHREQTDGKTPVHLPFSPDGYDERQYGSPGFNLPIGRLSRTPYGQYPEYHTSADNVDFIEETALTETLELCLDLVYLLENNQRYLNLAPKGEPQLGRRGLYSAGDTEALRWVLNLSDGEHTLLDMAEHSNLTFSRVKEAADLLRQHDLLREINEQL